MVSSFELDNRASDVISGLRKSENWCRFADGVVNFNHYSYKNIALIIDQAPKATYVKTYKQWLAVGRHVRKGEHAIRLIAGIKKGQQGADVPEHYLVSVFDISQTLPMDDHPPFDVPIPNADIDDVIDSVNTWLDDEKWESKIGPDDSDHTVVDFENKVIEFKPSDSASSTAKDMINVCVQIVMQKDHLLGPSYKTVFSTISYIVASALGIVTHPYDIQFVSTWNTLTDDELSLLANRTVSVSKGILKFYQDRD